jgi:hypothetical protein
MHRVDREDRMRVRGAAPHFGGDPNRFHELLFGRALFQCELGVATDAIRALGHMRYGDCNEFFGFLRQRAVGKAALAERPKGAVNFWRKLPSLLCQILRSVGIHVLFHGNRSFP